MREQEREEGAEGAEKGKRERQQDEGRRLEGAGRGGLEGAGE